MTDLYIGHLSSYKWEEIKDIKIYFTHKSERAKGTESYKLVGLFKQKPKAVNKAK